MVKFQGLIIDVLNEKGYAVGEGQVRSVIEKILAEFSITGNNELSVSFVGEGEMKKLHGKYMETHEVTDVLSFPFQNNRREPITDPDGLVRWGDIVVCYPVAAKQAKESGKSTQEEIDFLVEHSCRHLLGIHHEE